MQKIKNFLEKIKKRLEFYLVKNTTNLEKLNHIIYRKEHARLNFDLHAIEHGSLLESLVILNKPKTIVELGVAHGSSIKYLCSGAQILDTLIKNDSKFKNTSSEKSSSHIYGFDLWEKHGANNQYERIGSKQEVEKYLNEFGYKNFTLVKCDLNTIEAKNYFNNFKKIDFCYIDACHSYNGVKKNFDLVFCCGVLIHQNPKYLKKFYSQIYSLSNKYIYISEYFNPTPVMIDYKGNKDKLFKRDFAKELWKMFPNLSIIDYGFNWKEDPLKECDNSNWFLFKKSKK